VKSLKVLVVMIADSFRASTLDDASASQHLVMPESFWIVM
jgi:hypothetical protein